MSVGVASGVKRLGSFTVSPAELGGAVHRKVHQGAQPSGANPQRLGPRMLARYAAVLLSLPPMVAALAARGKSVVTTERTNAGLQYVLPGAERRTAPRSVCSMDSTGQLLMPGYEPTSEQELLSHRAGLPLAPRRGQKPVEYTPLFAR